MISTKFETTERKAVQLTEEEHGLLHNIVNDKFSVGAFSGMIYNHVKDCDSWDNETIDLHIQLALKVRLRMVELTR